MVAVARCLFILASAVAFFSLSAPAVALEAAPAPAGKALTVARKVIADNWEKSDCPSVTKAFRWQDGSIKAACSNGETFRIFTVVPIQKPVAVKCSASEKLGIPGC